MGAAAVQALSEGESGVMIRLEVRRIGCIPLKEVVGRARLLDPDTYEMAEMLAGLPEEVSYR